jgi:DNA-binding transcriptional ArsR family regulator
MEHPHAVATPSSAAAANAHRLDAVKADLFKGLAHPARIRVLEALVDADDVPVATLLAHTGLEASNLSQHLAVLRNHNLVVAERRGSQVFYQLAYPEVANLMAIAKTLLVSILETTRQNLSSTVSAIAIRSTLAEASPVDPATVRAVSFPTSSAGTPRTGAAYDRAAAALAESFNRTTSRADTSPADTSPVGTSSVGA